MDPARTGGEPKMGSVLRRRTHLPYPVRSARLCGHSLGNVLPLRALVDADADIGEWRGRLPGVRPDQCLRSGERETFVLVLCPAAHRANGSSSCGLLLQDMPYAAD